MITLLAPYWAVNVREGNDTARTETRHRSSAWPGPQEHLTCVTIFLHIVDNIDQVGYPVRVMYFFQVGSPYSFRRFSCGSVLFHHRVSEMQIWCCTKYPMIADTGNSRKNNIVTVEKGLPWILQTKTQNLHHHVATRRSRICVCRLEKLSLKTTHCWWKPLQ